jgi:hypothetical protein
MLDVSEREELVPLLQGRGGGAIVLGTPVQGTVLATMPWVYPNECFTHILAVQAACSAV